MVGWKYFKCEKCGFRSVNVRARYTTGDAESDMWVDISCKKCGYGIYYNGA